MIVKEFIKEGFGFFGQDVDSWTENWNAVDSILISSKNAEKNYLSYFFRKYFPKYPQKILEGGCGTGKYVIAYRNLGYDITGVDFSGKTIKRIKDEMGVDFPVYEADITALPFGDGYFDCYFSGGVMEHFESGPDIPLKEARRVIKKGGLLLVTVPYINLIRRFYLTIFEGKLKKGYFVKKVNRCQEENEVYPGYKFCEYIFDVNSLRPYFKNNGFSIEATYPADFLWGEIGFLFRKFLNKNNNELKYHPSNQMTLTHGGSGQNMAKHSSFIRNLAYNFLITENISNIFFKIPLAILNYLSGHMILIVARAV